MGLYQVQGFQGVQTFRINSLNSIAYFLDTTDPTKLYSKAIDGMGNITTRSYTISEDKISNGSDYVTQEMLEEILDDKLEKLFKKYNNRSRNHKNQNREVENNA